MSALGVAGVVLVVAGAVMVVVAMVRARRAGPSGPAPVSALAGRGLSFAQSWRLVRAAQGRAPVPSGRVELVRALAFAEADAPAPSAAGFLGVALVLAGAGALAGLSVLGGLWLAPAVMVGALPWQMHARRRRARAVLTALPPEGGPR